MFFFIKNGIEYRQPPDKTMAINSIADASKHGGGSQSFIILLEKITLMLLGRRLRRMTMSVQALYRMSTSCISSFRSTS